jgi:hypothetical protein
LCVACSSAVCLVGGFVSSEDGVQVAFFKDSRMGT